jgi:hypothetical protein
LVGGRLLDAAQVRPPVTPMNARGEHQPVELHHPPDALAVVARPKRPVYHRPHSAVAVGGPAVRHRADLLQDGRIGRPVITPIRTGPGHVIRRPPRDPQDRADHGERQAGHRADSLRNDGFF